MAKAVEVHIKGGLALRADNPGIVDEKIDWTVPEHGSYAVKRVLAGDIDSVDDLAGATSVGAH
ncbi:hypothetical protein ACVINY_003899 [Sinorhizobium meliloti]